MNIVGNKYNMLTVVSYTGRKRGTHREIECVCDCGTHVVTINTCVVQGHRKSCGCARIKHGASYSAEYSSWKGMKSRCYNEKNIRYRHYGGRGIFVCDRWKSSFENFLEDMGPKPSAVHSIERIDVDGNYEPKNCEWATPQKQSRNKRKERSKTGERGISLMPNGKDFKAGITVNDRRVHIGVYRSLEEAKKARSDAERKYWG